jgi:hypothetical protein
MTADDECVDARQGLRLGLSRRAACKTAVCHPDTPWTSGVLAQDFTLGVNLVKVLLAIFAVMHQVSNSIY